MSRSPENKTNNSSFVNIVIGTISECLDSDCNGWLVDSIIGKYWVQCLDSKHNTSDKKVKMCGKGCEPSTHSTSHNNQSSQKENLRHDD